MRCRTARERISRSLDGDLSARASARLERHLAACTACRALRQELRAVVEGAARLDAPQPSREVWWKLRAELAAAAPHAECTRAGRRGRSALGLPTCRLAGALAAAALLLLAGIIAGTRLRRGARPAAAESGAAYALAKLDEAERHYEEAVKALAEAFAARKPGLPPELAELLDRNLAVVDAAIQSCRAAVLAEPEDLDARGFLLAAYTRKLALLDSALALERWRYESS